VLIGNVVIGVFHTLFAGKAGQFVPGRMGATTRAEDLVDTRLERVVAFEVTGAATNTKPALAKAAPMMSTRRERPRSRPRAIKKVYFEFTIRRTRLSKSCATS
jgi:hypothetical protein